MPMTRTCTFPSPRASGKRARVRDRRFLHLIALLLILATPALAQTPPTPPRPTPTAPRPTTRPGPPVPAAAPTPTSTQAASPTQVGSDAGTNVKVERGAGGKKIYKITTEIRIEGKIQKPEAFYVLQKSSINYEWQDLKQDFLPKILDSVSQAPF
jgi:hypothetical protein